MNLRKETIAKIIEIFKSTGHDSEILWETKEIQGTNTVVTIKCNICNSTENFYISNLYKGKYSCSGCRENQLKERANVLNFEYVEQVRNKGKKIRVILKCRTDNSITTAQSYNLLTKKVRCEACVINSYKSSLALKNCNYISHKTTNGFTKVTFRNNHNEVRTISAMSLLYGNWAISDNVSSWIQKSFVYCFTFYLKNDEYLNDGLYYKIGVSSNPELRLKRLKLKYKVNVEILEEFSDRFLANEREKQLHLEHSFYKLSPDIAQIFTDGVTLGKLINGKRLKNKDGITEWFYNKQGT